MNYMSILSDLITQLETHYKNIFLHISKEQFVSEEITERHNKIKILTEVIHKQIHKSKKFN